MSGVPASHLGPVALVWWMWLVVACSGETGTRPALSSGDRGARALERIRSSALHARHAAARPAVGCEGCHELVDGEYLRAKSWRCKQCHPTAPLAVHELAAVDSPARECFSCHDFASADVRATPCATCHATPQGAIRAIGPHDRSKPDQLDACTTCHRPHQQPTLAATACESCHREVVTGHTAPGIPITGCASCHGFHEPSREASTRCTNCHRQSRARVPVTATFTKLRPGSPAPVGHVACVTCHRQHRFVKTEVASCRSGECHDKQVAISEGKVREHRCIGCHANHDVRATAPRSCETTCHAKLVPALHHPGDRTTKTRCIGCHPPHRGAGAPLAVACSSCHQLASERAFHQGARGRGPECRGCHRPHEFDLSATGVALCRRCHGDQPVPDAKPIRTFAKHDNCFACHGDSVRHQPAGPRAACTSCHPEKGPVVRTGHARCVGCHDPHTTQQQAACGSCHAREATIARKDHRTCTNCHEPHGGAQKRTCGSCHAAEAATAPREHQRCTTCHDQHSTQVGKTCGSCHADRTTGVHARVDCKSCHRPHGPAGPPTPPACTTCHVRTALPLMHQVPAHGACASCHRSHGEQPHRTRAACLSCHADRKNHEPGAANCAACHNFGGVR